jgi:hypothetical protein
MMKRRRLMVKVNTELRGSHAQRVGTPLYIPYPVDDVDDADDVRE